jgi:hypothetical protein
MPPSCRQAGEEHKGLLTDDTEDSQNLAMALFLEAWRTRWNMVDSAPEHGELGVTMKNLQAVDGTDFAFTADLDVWICGADDRMAGTNMAELAKYWLFQSPGLGLPSLANWLMSFNSNLETAVAEYTELNHLRPPGTANALLRMAEKNPWSEMAKTPQGMAVELKPFQRMSLAWMMAQEAGEGLKSHI